MVLGFGLLLVIAIFLVIINTGRGGGQALMKEEVLKLDSLVRAIDDQILLANHSDSSDIGPGEVFPNESPPVYFTFDPNLAEKEDFLKLGLSEEISNRIIKYRNSGGKFYKPDDLKKIYGLEKNEYENLAPFILIEPLELVAVDKLNAQKNDTLFATREQPPVPFDINKVDSTTLMTVNGIGKVLSVRIVKFRKSLGGFINVNQLDDIYGIEEYARNNLVKQSFVDESFTPQKININLWPADSIARHPYIDYNIANVIVSYREQHGSFSKPEDLLDIRIIELSWIEKVTPYLAF